MAKGHGKKMPLFAAMVGPCGQPLPEEGLPVDSKLAHALKGV
jgi:hypothetical protein